MEKKRWEGNLFRWTGGGDINIKRTLKGWVTTRFLKASSTFL